ncbi:hypothetical protein Tco_1487956 [Tanacetum coccineum]
MGQQPQKQVIPADKLVTTKYQRIRRCNNYAMLQNIPCSKECNIVGILLVDHALSHALNATADFPTVYIQQFWNTVKLVPNVNDTICFTIDRETITYTVDMFCDTLKLPVEIPDHPLIEPAYLKFIQRFLTIVGYEGIVDKKKDVIQYPRFTKLIIADLMKKFSSIGQRLEENYHSIKNDIPLVSMYTTGNVTIRGMLIPKEFLTNDIHATPEYKKYKKEFVRVDVPTIQPELKRKGKEVVGESSTPRKSLKGIIKQKKPSTTPIPLSSDDRERDDITEATLINDKDTSTRIEPESHKENPKVVDDEVEKKKDDEKDDDNDDDKNDDNDDHDDHALVRNKVSGRSVAELSRRRGQLREQLTNTFITKEYFEGKMKEMSDTLNNLVPELSVAKTNELLKEAIPRMVNDAVK